MYFFYYPISLLAAAFGSLTPAHVRIFFVFFVLQILGVILALDTNMTDFASYARHYQNVPLIDSVLRGHASIFDAYGEPGFVLMQSVAKYFSFSYVEFRLLFFFLLMTLNTIVICWFKWSALLVLPWYFAFFYHNDGNIIRMAFSSTLLMLAILQFSSGEFKKSLLLSVLAVSFHYSALLIVPLYILRKINPKAYLSSIFLILSILFGVIGFTAIVVELINMLGFTSEAYVVDKVLRYAQSDREGGGLIRSITVFPFFILLFCIVRYKKLLGDNELAYIFFITFLFSLLNLFLFSDLRLFADRAFRMFGLSGGFLMYYIILSFSKRSRPIIVLLYLFYLFLFTAFKYQGYSWELTYY